MESFAEYNTPKTQPPWRSHTNKRSMQRTLRPISLTKERQRNKEAPATEKEIAALRAINGAANWLSSQSQA